MSDLLFIDSMSIPLEMGVHTTEPLHWRLEEVTDYCNSKYKLPFIVTKIKSGKIVAGIGCQRFVKINLKNPYISVSHTALYPASINDHSLLEVAEFSSKDRQVVKKLADLILRYYLIKEHIDELPTKPTENSFMSDVDLSPLISKYQVEITDLKINNYLSFDGHIIFLIAEISCQVSKTSKPN